MASVEATNKNTGGLTFRDCAMNQTMRPNPLKRRLWKCDTTRAGKGQLSLHSGTLIMHSEHSRLSSSVLHRSADIALLAGGSRKRWIIATENMQAGDIIKTSGVIGRMAGRGSTLVCHVSNNPLR